MLLQHDVAVNKIYKSLKPLVDEFRRRKESKTENSS